MSWLPKGKKEGATKGTIQALPCGWCGEMIKGLDELLNLPIEERLKVNSVIECDYCHNLLEITALYSKVVVQAERHGEMKEKGHLK